MRGALLWVGQCDPVETMEDARGLDPKLDALTAVLTQWWSVIGASGYHAETSSSKPPGLRPGWVSTRSRSSAIPPFERRC